MALPRGSYKSHPNHVLEPDGAVHAYAPPDHVARDGVATTWDQTDVAWAGSGPVPYADARRLTMVAVDERRSRQFTLLLPRDRLDAVDIATDRPGSVRRFRVSDLDPELTTSTSLQIEAFVAAQAAELAAELLG